MKKIMTGFVLVIMIFLVTVQFSFAGLNENYLLLDVETSTGPGTEKIVKQAYRLWGCEVIITGAPTVVTVRVEGNQGADIYDPGGMAELTMSAAQLAAGIATFEIAFTRVVKIRGNLITLTGGTTPTVSLNCVGGD